MPKPQLPGSDLRNRISNYVRAGAGAVVAHELAACKTLPERSEKAKEMVLRHTPIAGSWGDQANRAYHPLFVAWTKVMSVPGFMIHTASASAL